MNILITGGAGFVGSHLTDKLIESGHQVLVVDDLSTGKREHVNQKAEFVKLDIREKEELSKVVSDFGPEVVYHLAAQKNVRTSLTNPRLDAEINILGGINLLKTCLDNKVKKFIFTSTGGVYGDSKILPTPENAELDPLSPYILNKLTFERYLEILAHDKMSWVAVRPANIYGPRQDPYGEAGVISIFIDWATKGETLKVNGDGEQTRDFIFINDVIDAFLIFLSKGQGVYNLSTGQEVSLNHLIGELEKSLGQKLNIQNNPAIEGEIKRSALDFSKIHQELNWQTSYNFEKGLKLTIDWFRSNGNITAGDKKNNE